MNKLILFITAPAYVALAACGAEEPETNNSADDFAARINGNTPPTVEATVAPSVAPPRENAAPGAFTPGTATDPQSSICNANKMGPFIGKPADDATRAAIMEAGAGAADIRFIAPGNTYVNPDPTNPRLNIMIDTQGIIRDARCG